MYKHKIMSKTASLLYSVQRSTVSPASKWRIWLEIRLSLVKERSQQPPCSSAPISSPFLFRVFCLYLLLHLLLHLYTVLSMPLPVCSLAPLIAVARLSTPSTLVVCQVGHISMAEPADATGIVILWVGTSGVTSVSLATCSWSCRGFVACRSTHTALSGFPSFFQNVANLCPVFCVWVGMYGR